MYRRHSLESMGMLIGMLLVIAAVVSFILAAIKPYIWLLVLSLCIAIVGGGAFLFYRFSRRY